MIIASKTDDFEGDEIKLLLDNGSKSNLMKTEHDTKSLTFFF